MTGPTSEMPVGIERRTTIAEQHDLAAESAQLSEEIRHDQG